MTKAPGSFAPGNRFDKHPWLTGVVIALVLVFIADLSIGTFSYRSSRAKLRRGLAYELTYRRRDSLYHHDFVPLKRVDSAIWGGVFYRVRTNSLGAKDAEPRILAEASDKPRVVIMGDSFSEGIGVEFESTFVGRLAARARPAGVEILNAAVASYSPVVYRRKMQDMLERRTLRVDEVIVFLDISDIQDETFYYLDKQDHVQRRDSAWNAYFQLPDDGTGSGPPLMRLKRLWGKHSFAVVRALGVLRRWKPSWPASGPTCAPPVPVGNLICRGGWTSSHAIMDAYGNAGLALAKTHMTELATLLKQRGIPMTVVVYPWSYQLAWNDRHSLQSTVWSNWAREQQVDFVDLFPAFFAQVDSTSLGSVTSRFDLPGDIHWSAGGHAFVEQQLVHSYCGMHARPESGRPPLATAICDAAP